MKGVFISLALAVGFLSIVAAYSWAINPRCEQWRYVATMCGDGAWETRYPCERKLCVRFGR